MASQSEKLEMRGRLWLWSSALNECELILMILRRNAAEIDSGRPSEKEQRFSAAFQEYLNSKPNYVPGKLKHSDLVEFTELHPKEYPAFTDCISIQNYLRMLAVVLFCQMLNRGNYDPGRASGNTKHFVETHIEQIRNSVFSSDSAKEEFRRFCGACLTARDQMIGHADGAAFQIEHGTPVSKMKMVSASIERIDFSYMERVVKPLNRAVLEHAEHVSV